MTAQQYFRSDERVALRDFTASRDFHSKRGRLAAFTLVEMLVSMAILVFIIGIIFSMIQTTSKVWINTAGKVEGFRGARAAFDAITRTLSQATLNPYYAYTYAVSNGTNSFTPASAGPIGFARNSDLQVVAGQGLTLIGAIAHPFGFTGGYTPVTHCVFFQAPLGMETNSAYANLGSLINACGFYVVYGPDVLRPGYVPTASTRYRYRLMQYLQSSDALQIYTSGQVVTTWGSGVVRTDLHTTVGGPPPKSNFVLAENIVALVILPKLAAQDELALQNNAAYSAKVTSSTPLGTALAPNYSYDSSTTGQGGTLNASGVAPYPMLNSLNQMPPVFQVTMVAIDEASALKLGDSTTAPNTQLGLTSTLFTTASSFQADLQTLEGNLAALPGNAAGNTIPLNFHVFQTDVAVRGAKWTSDN